MNPSSKIFSQRKKSLFLLILLCATTATAPALLVPFSKERIQLEGKNCVSGFQGNFGAESAFFAGPTSDLNKALRSILASDQFLSKVVVIHPGSSVLPDYLKPENETSVDWQVSSLVKPTNTIDLKQELPSLDTGFHLQIDIWLGGNIKLDELKIPQQFEVRSSKELENFVALHEQQKTLAEPTGKKTNSTDPDKQ